MNRIKYTIKFWLNLLLASAISAAIPFGESVIFKSLFFVLTVIFAANILILITKRLHDINLSSWWVLLTFIPLIGTIFSFILWVFPGTKNENRFGLPPAKASKLEYAFAVLIIIFMTLFFIVILFILYFSSLYTPIDKLSISNNL
ncbi:hypothetical protein I862_03260 [endosymbiont of Acanthamoeba sp. UWC8]|nr:hypothetical protein I862_03260 [endosymbiont of Acanthamoeba sp. UWC8]